MGFDEDRSDFNSTGWRGALKRLMASKEEGFVKLDVEGWGGEIVEERPAPGSGAFLYFKRGEPPVKFNNATPSDASSTELGKWEV